MSHKNESRKVRVVPKRQGRTCVPSVRLAGKYLLNLGFNFADVVEITPVGDGSLNIRRLGDDVRN